MPVILKHAQLAYTYSRPTISTFLTIHRYTIVLGKYHIRATACVHELFHAACPSGLEKRFGIAHFGRLRVHQIHE